VVLLIIIESVLVKAASIVFNIITFSTEIPQYTMYFIISELLLLAGAFHDKTTWCGTSIAVNA
jgi:hypothetical protein